MIQGAYFNSNEGSSKKQNDNRTINIKKNIFGLSFNTKRRRTISQIKDVHKLAFDDNERLGTEDNLITPTPKKSRVSKKISDYRVNAVHHDNELYDYNVGNTDQKEVSPVKDFVEENMNDTFISHISHQGPEKLKKKKTMHLGENSKYIFQTKTKLFDGFNFIDTKEAEFLYYKYYLNSVLQCLVSFISVVTGIIEYEISYNNKAPKSDILALWISFISSINLWVLIVFEYYINCKILYHNKRINESIWRASPKNIKSLIITFLIFLIHPNPLFKDVNVTMFNSKYNVTTHNSLNSIFALVSLLRLWYVVKYFLVSSKYHSPRIQRVCEMNNFDTNIGFSMKANMTKTPYELYLVLFMIVLTFCSFGLRIFERELDNYTGMNFGSYWNTIWCLVTTMTTVGYGDFMPSTLCGRIIGIISCLCGVFLISMLIVTITNVLVFEGYEKNVYLLLERIALTEDKDILAARLVAKYVKLMKSLKRKNINVKEKDELRDKVLMNLIEFKEKCAEIESTYPPYSNFDNILDCLEDVDNSLENLSKKYDDLKYDLNEIVRNK